MTRFHTFRPLRGVLATMALLGLAACTSGPMPDASERRERLVAVTADHELIVFDSRRPDTVLEEQTIPRA